MPVMVSGQNIMPMTVWLACIRHKSSISFFFITRSPPW
jgi:hypothetical protein